MRILIADDSTLVRNSLKKLLLSLDNSLQIGESTNIQQTLKIFQKLNADLIILDIRMPDGNGIEALKIIKKQKPEQKVMIFTNYPNALNRAKCKAAGAEYFFDKSVDFEQLYETVKKLNDAIKEKADDKK